MKHKRTILALAFTTTLFACVDEQANLGSLDVDPAFDDPFACMRKKPLSWLKPHIFWKVVTTIVPATAAIVVKNTYPSEATCIAAMKKRFDDMADYNHQMCRQTCAAAQPPQDYTGTYFLTVSCQDISLNTGTRYREEGATIHCQCQAKEEVCNDVAPGPEWNMGEE